MEEDWSFDLPVTEESLKTVELANTPIVLDQAAHILLGEGTEI